MQKHFFKVNNTEYICLLGAIIALCLSFAPLLFDFVWGNHDWIPIQKDNSFTAGLIEGRFAQYALLNIFLMGKIFPLLNIVLGFIFYAAALVLLWSRFFKFSTPTLTAALFTTACATLPYINEIIYFQFIVFSQLTWPFFIVLALIEAQKASQSNYVLHTSFSTLLLFFAIGGYPAAAGLYTTAACLWAIKLNMMQTNVKSLVKHLLPFIYSMIFAFIFLSLVYNWLQQHNMMLLLYNNQKIALSEFARNIPQTLGIAIHSFLQPQPYFSLPFKALSAAIVLLFIIKCTTQPQNMAQCLRTFFLIAALLLAIKFPALLAGNQENNYFAAYDPIGYMVRTDFYTIPCLILFCLFYLYQTEKKLLRNLLCSTAFLLIWLNISANLAFCKTQILGFRAENNLLERIITKIQNTPRFTANQAYTLIQVGELPLRPKFYQPGQLEKYGYYTLQVPYTRYWEPNEYYNFYVPTPFVKSGNNINPQRLTPQAVNFLTTEITFWPSSSAVFVDDEYIIVALTQSGKNMLTEQFNAIMKN